MADRNFQRESNSLLSKPVKLWCVLNFGATGAVTLEQWQYPSGSAASGSYAAAVTSVSTPNAQPGTGGICSVVKSGTGDYTITLQDSYQRLVYVDALWTWWNTATTQTAPAAPNIVVVGANQGAAPGNGFGAGPGTVVAVQQQPGIGAGTIEILTQNGSSVNTSPANGEQVILEISFDDGTTQA